MKFSNKLCTTHRTPTRDFPLEIITIKILKKVFVPEKNKVKSIFFIPQLDR